VNPHLVIDCHTTNGSIHRFAMTFDIPHVPDSGRREPIDYMRRRLLPAVQAAVKAHDGLDSFWYGNFLRDEGGEGMGWITYPHHPRFGGNYRGLTNRLDLLLRPMPTYPFPSGCARRMHSCANRSGTWRATAMRSYDYWRRARHRPPRSQ